MEYEDVTTIQTPEGVDLSLTLAGVGSRFAAALVDYSIQLLILVALAAALFGGLALAGGDTGGGVAGAIYAIASFLLFVGYDISFEVLASGRTPGKRLNGLRVVRMRGEPVTFLTSAVRNVLRVIDILPGAYLVGAVSVLATAQNQRIGDVIAGTLVVRERRAGTRSPSVPVYAPPTRFDEGESWDTSAVTTDELAAVRSFLERRLALEAGARSELARTLATRLRPKVVGAPPTLPTERFLELLVAAKSSRG